MFIDDLLIGVILCGLVMSVVYLRVDLLGSRRQKTASHAVHELAASNGKSRTQNGTLRSAEIREGHRKVRAGAQRRRMREAGSVPAHQEKRATRE
jgi:hypothetical protein